MGIEALGRAPENESVTLTDIVLAPGRLAINALGGLVCGARLWVQVPEAIINMRDEMRQELQDVREEVGVLREVLELTGRMEGHTSSMAENFERVTQRLDDLPEEMADELIEAIRHPKRREEERKARQLRAVSESEQSSQAA